MRNHTPDPRCKFEEAAKVPDIERRTSLDVNERKGTMELSRRNFLKSAAAVAGVAGMGALAGTSVKTAHAEEVEVEDAGTITYDETIKWDGQYDVVVVGFGDAGASTSLAAANEGASVLLLDKAPLGSEGGNSRYAGQLFANGRGDLEETQYYYQKLAGDFELPDDVFEVWTEGVANISDQFASVLELDASEFYDCSEDSDGENASSQYVTMYSPEYPEFTTNDSMAISILHDGYSDGYMWNCYREQIVNHADSIDVWLESPVTKLIQEPNTKTVLGVTVERGGEELNIRATNGVVLTCGGFENNRTMLKDYLGLESSAYLGTEYNTGDGINMAKAAGADLWHMHVYEGMLDYGTSFRVEEGERAIQMMIYCETGAYIMVSGDGYRFLNESESARHGHIYHNDGEWDNPWYPKSMFLVFDATNSSFADIALAYGSEYVQADSIAELAELIGADADVLEQTIEDYNSFAEVGHDPAFQRDADTMQAFGDGPYYAIEYQPVVLNTQGGPRRNANAEIVDVDGNAIPHLYGAGECGGITSNMYQGGSNLAECLIFGQIAGKNAAAEKDPLDAYVVEAVESDLVYTLGVMNDLAEDESEEAETETDDGTLVGTGTGIGGDFNVYVTVDEDGAITSVEVGENSETEGIGSVAIEELPEQFIGLSTAEEIDAVDGTSGATVTSNAIKEAIKDALGLE